MKRNNKGFPSAISGTSVEVINDNFAKAMSQFKRKVSNADIIKECRDRQYYEKPSTVRQRKSKAARNRWERKLREMQPTKR